MTTQKTNQRSNASKGFASMPHEKVQEIASKGGRASHKSGSESNADRAQRGNSSSHRSDASKSNS